LAYTTGTKKGAAIFYDDKLYLSRIESAGAYSFAIFENVHLSNNNNVISTAPGFGYNVSNFNESSGTAAESASLNSTILTNQSNAVTAMQGFSVSLSSGVFSTSSSLGQVSLRADINSYNGMWQDVVFNDLTINAGILTATDEDGCNIDGTATDTGIKNIFSFNVAYSNCAKSGNYDGVLTLRRRNSVTELNWMAFDGNNHGVFASVDTQVTQDESLALTNKLKPSLYLNSSKLAITTGTQIYSLEYSLNSGSANPFVFQYTFDNSTPTLINGQGKGLVDTSPISSAALNLAVTPGMENIDLQISYAPSKTINYSNLQYIDPGLLIDTLEGNWGQLVVNSNNVLSGSINSCSLTGQVNNYEENIANVTMTLSGCAQLGTYTGVMTVVDSSVFNVQNDGIIAVMFSANGQFSFSGIVGRN
jgi:hypothetical protein